MTILPDPVNPRRSGFSRILGVLLGMALVYGLYTIAEPFFRGEPPVSVPTGGTPDGGGSARQLPREQGLSGDPGRQRVDGQGGQGSPAWHLRCVAALTHQPLKGLRAYDTQADEDLGVRSDERGRLTLPGLPAARILLYGDGFLYRMLQRPMDQGLQPGPKVREIEVYRDRYTLALQIRARFPQGTRDSEPLRLQVRRSDGKAMDGASFPTALFGDRRRLDPLLRRAWLTHSILASMDPERVLAMQGAPAWVLGEPLRPLLLPHAGGRLRFAESGPFVLRAWTLDGLVAEARFTLRPSQHAPVVLEFRTGRLIQVQLRDSAGRPVPEAQTYLFLGREGEDEELRQGVTNKDGRVTWSGLVGDETLRIRVETSGYQVLDRPLSFSDKEQLLQLQPLARQDYQLQVLEKGSGKALSGVRVSLGPEKRGKTLRGETDASGRLTIPVAIGETFRLELQRKEYIVYAEMIGGPGQTLPKRFEMIPESVDRQAALGLICLIDGTVRQPRNSLVTLVVKDPGLRAPGGMVLRRYLAGNVPERRLRCKVGAAGRFRLWTDQKGQAALILFNDAGKQQKDLLLVPGQTLHPAF